MRTIFPNGALSVYSPIRWTSLLHFILANGLLDGADIDSTIPAKFHCDQSYYQSPLEPTMKIKDALDLFKLQNHKIFYFGIEIADDTLFSDITKITYPDTFVHLVLHPT